MADALDIHKLDKALMEPACKLNDWDTHNLEGAIIEQVHYEVHSYAHVGTWNDYVKRISNMYNKLRDLDSLYIESWLRNESDMISVFYDGNDEEGHPIGWEGLMQVKRCPVVAALIKRIKDLQADIAALFYRTLDAPVAAQ